MSSPVNGLPCTVQHAHRISGCRSSVFFLISYSADAQPLVGRQRGRMRQIADRPCSTNGFFVTRNLSICTEDSEDKEAGNAFDPKGPNSYGKNIPSAQNNIKLFAADGLHDRKKRLTEGERRAKRKKDAFAPLILMTNPAKAGFVKARSRRRFTAGMNPPAPPWRLVDK